MFKHSSKRASGGNRNSCSKFQAVSQDSEIIHCVDPAVEVSSVNNEVVNDVNAHVAWALYSRLNRLLEVLARRNHLRKVVNVSVQRIMTCGSSALSALNLIGMRSLMFNMLRDR